MSEFWHVGMIGYPETIPEGYEGDLRGIGARQVYVGCLAGALDDLVDHMEWLAKACGFTHGVVIQRGNALGEWVQA